jgi:hypothetical protein
LKVKACIFRCGQKIAKDRVKFNVPGIDKTGVDFPLPSIYFAKRSKPSRRLKPTAPEVSMSHLKLYHLFVILLLLAVVATANVSAQTATRASQDQKDSSRTATVEEMAKRVDSLQFIVVYNAELLRRDLDAKMVLIYVMLGIIILASMLMYALLKQTQRQRIELEERLSHHLSASVADLDARIKDLQARLAPPPKPAPKKPATKRAVPKKRG